MVENYSLAAPGPDPIFGDFGCGMSDFTSLPLAPCYLPHSMSSVSTKSGSVHFLPLPHTTETPTPDTQSSHPAPIPS